MSRSIRGLVAGAFVLASALPVTLALTATSASAETTVATEAELDAAFSDGTVTSIVLANDITLTCATGQLERNENTNALVVESSSFTSAGGGFSITQTCANNRVAFQDGTAALDFQHVEITGGHSTSGGGGIWSDGDVTLDNTVVSGNQAEDSSGGGPTARARSPSTRRASMTTRPPAAAAVVASTQAAASP
jgi:hypothetical protein